MPDVTLEHVPGMKTATPVPVLQVTELPASIFVRDYVVPSKPCVIKGAVKHWAALRKWRDKDYLKERSGHHNVFLYSSEYRIQAPVMQATEKSMRFAEAIDALHSEKTRLGIVVTGLPNELLSDLGGLPFLNKAEAAFAYPPARYFFYRNAGTTWHYHPFDETLMSQIVGTKKIGLLQTNTPAFKAMRDLFFKEDYYDDPSVFDNFDGSGLEWFSAELDEGDGLYIPPLWWHWRDPHPRCVRRHHGGDLALAPGQNRQHHKADGGG